MCRRADNHPVHNEEIAVEEDDVPVEGPPVDTQALQEMFSPLEEARRAFDMFDADGSGELDLKYVSYSPTAYPLIGEL